MDNIKKIAEIDLSIVLPCLNEEEAIESCLDSIRKVINNYPLSTEVIVVDNDSTDKSASIIKEYQKNNPSFPLILVEEKIRGYGSAYLAGFDAAKG
jgi:glycosyltransferase involved in cell wall biosynthesis